MASTSLALPTAAGAARRRPFFSHRSPSRVATARFQRAPRLIAFSASASAPPPSSSSTLEALIFDCDGVILESENLHRQAYNDAFAHFGVRCPQDSAGPLYWDEAFYDELQNRIGGGKPKMRWYFGENGWPSSKIFETPPLTDSDKEKLVDVIQDWKTERYKEIIKSGTVEPRPGVLQLMDEVKGAGIKLAVCSSSDDVKLKKPDPTIYITASKKLGVESKNCLVVEDSVIGLLAAKGAGMSCIITYTPSTANQDFKDAIATYPDLSNVRLEDLKLLLQKTLVTG
ncbi:hypothetical protein U9M48_038477 [Paspalum notatum var. saurae]|uniref:Haloacid dehalogenase-like hydrolase domain-containing protein n=1 Tax=Paspalum notatum var. saurae TaxID=547442 RepID=A0AAQ3ULE1_PASNO